MQGKEEGTTSTTVSPQQIHTSTHDNKGLSTDIHSLLEKQVRQQSQHFGSCQVHIYVQLLWMNAGFFFYMDFTRMRDSFATFTILEFDRQHSVDWMLKVSSHIILAGQFKRSLRHLSLCFLMYWVHCQGLEMQQQLLLT